MSLDKIGVLLLFILFHTTGYSQDNKSDSLDCKRESLDGYFSQNKQFCDKFEEFMDVVNIRYSVAKTPLILITNIGPNSNSENDSLAVVRVEVKERGFFPVFLKINSEEIYLYGGKFKGRYIFLRQESIFGKLFRSDFGFYNILMEIDPSLGKGYSNKYNELMNEGSFTVIVGQPFMDFVVNRKGDIIKVKYYQNDERGFVIHNNINDYKKSLIP